MLIDIDTKMYLLLLAMMPSSGYLFNLSEGILCSRPAGYTKNSLCADESFKKIFKTL